MKGFYDIEGTEICEGDEVLYTSIPWRASSDLERGKVKKFTPQNVVIDGTRMAMNQTERRILIIKGEFKTYTKEELIIEI